MVLTNTLLPKKPEPPICEMKYDILHAQETSTAVEYAIIEQLQDVLYNPCLYNPMHGINQMGG